MLDIQQRRVQLMLFITGVLALSMTAEKFRELVGKEAASKSGQFTFLNCFDMGSGTLACTAKEGIKLYVYNIRTVHMERVRQRAIEKALADAVSEGLTATEAAKQAHKIGAKAAKVAAREAKRILGPIISSGWDFFEAMYFGGSMAEGFLRGTGTLFGTYVGGFHGEQRLGRLGYLAGSHLGSWGGGRIGLMIYDVINGVEYMLQSVQLENQSSSYASEDGSEYTDNYISDTREESTYADNYASEEGQESSSYASEDGSEYTDNYISDTREESTYTDNYASGEGQESTYYETSEEKQEESKWSSLF